MAKFCVREGTFSCCQILISSLLLTLTTFGSIPEQCARFTFPDNSPGTRVTIVEGSQINFPFKLDTSLCSDYSNKTIYVSVEQPDGTDFCAVRLKPEGCGSYNKKNCACVDEKSADKGAVLTKIVTKEDKGAWVWRTGDGAVRTTLMFAVQAAIAVPSTVKYAGTDHGPNIETTNNDVIFTSTFQVESTFNPGIDLKSQGGNVETKEDDDDEDGFVDSSMKTGMFVSGAHIIAFVFIAFVGFICRRKRKRRGRRRPNRKLPPLPIDLIGDEVTPMQGPGNDAGSNTTSGHYEDIPDTYENDRVASECPVEEENDVLPAGRRPEPLVGLVVNDYELPGRMTSRQYDQLPGAVDVQTDDYSDERESGYGYDDIVV
ncbi:uncharacterized protein [Littorina saxatilis]|uniref:uncharacterized protein n=1 Tax=Littorina saxatilis TaxID=31220 RepID=UPI0038B540D7